MAKDKKLFKNNLDTFPPGRYMCDDNSQMIIVTDKQRLLINLTSLTVSELSSNAGLFFTYYKLDDDE